jgi:hypothetical protein
MKKLVAAAVALLATPALGEGYEPMALFAPYDGKTLRGEWSDPDGTKVVDIARWTMILGGRAIESTHRIEGSTYGGKTIIFFDEGAKKHIFHYFTTAGFHTTGEMAIDGEKMTTVEKVEGHASIASVRSVTTIKPQEMIVDVVYVGKDGAETKAGRRIYKPVDAPATDFE